MMKVTNHKVKNWLVITLVEAFTVEASEKTQWFTEISDQIEFSMARRMKIYWIPRQKKPVKL